MEGETAAAPQAALGESMIVALKTVVQASSKSSGFKSFWISYGKSALRHRHLSYDARREGTGGSPVTARRAEQKDSDSTLGGKP